jgi:hypothetical protein
MEQVQTPNAEETMMDQMTIAEANTLIANATSLQDLYASLVAIEQDADEIVRADIDYSALPTFGGAEPADTTSIWSWDAERILACDSQIGGTRWMLLDRCIVTVTNPWTGADVAIDLEAMTAGQFDSCVAAMDDATREELHETMAPCAPEAFMAAYVAMVGPKIAGIALLS